MNFSKEFLDFQYANTQKGRETIAENVKILLYKTVPDYFDLLDFDNDDLFMEPLLFAFFQSERKGDMDYLKQLLYGSIEIAERPAHITVQSDKYGHIFLPRIGWISNVGENNRFELEFRDGKYFLDGAPANIEAGNSNNLAHIELLKYPIALLDDRFYDASHNLIDVEITESCLAFQDKYTNSINFIFETMPWLSGLISKCCFRSVIFNDFSDPVTTQYCKRNSFASFMVKGISFHNIYQPWYDEVFFMDDISHQMGHIIFHALTYDSKRFYKVDPQTVFQSNSEYGKMIDELEDRTYEIILHALYTYFLTLNVLDECLESDAFTDEQKVEIKGRIAFYIRKCSLDFELWEDFNSNKVAAEIFSSEGLYIYVSMKKSFSEFCKKYNSLYLQCNWDNHSSYNYNHMKFIERNKLETGVAG